MKNFCIHISNIYAEENWNCGKSYDLTALSGTNCYCSEENFHVIRKCIEEIPERAVHWIDGGDYHYLSYFFLEKIKEPFNLLLIDRHPDNQDTFFGPDVLSCGNWIAYSARKLPMLRDEEDIALPIYISVDLDALSPDCFRTNWDQGDMTLEELISIISRQFATRRVLGIDICGGKSIEKGADKEDLLLNAKTRKILLEYLSKIE